MMLKKYKDLLNKEYSFCLKVIDEVIGKANKLYEIDIIITNFKVTLELSFLNSVADVSNVANILFNLFAVYG